MPSTDPYCSFHHSFIPVSRGCVCVRGGCVWQVIAHRLSTVIAADQIAYIKVRACVRAYVPLVANVRPVLLKPRACKHLLPPCVMLFFLGRGGRGSGDARRLDGQERPVFLVDEHADGGLRHARQLTFHQLHDTFFSSGFIASTIK